MTKEETLAESIRNYLESGVDLLLTDDDYKTIIKALERGSCEDISPTAIPLTAKEAKKLLYAEWKKEVQKDTANNRLLVAYNMAIEALEQNDRIKTELNRVKTELEPCEDCISRKETIQAVSKNEPNEDINFGVLPLNNRSYADILRCLMLAYDKGQEDAISKIANLPSVQPKPRAGHWIEKSNIYGVAYCSECGYELKINNTKYCPNCGTKMEE